MPSVFFFCSSCLFSSVRCRVLELNAAVINIIAVIATIFGCFVGGGVVVIVAAMCIINFYIHSFIENIKI